MVVVGSKHYLLIQSFLLTTSFDRIQSKATGSKLFYASSHRIIFGTYSQYPIAFLDLLDGYVCLSLILSNSLIDNIEADVGLPSRDGEATG
jgi:hypothetical protein